MIFYNHVPFYALFTITIIKHIELIEIKYSSVTIPHDGQCVVDDYEEAYQ